MAIDQGPGLAVGLTNSRPEAPKVKAVNPAVVLAWLGVAMLTFMVVVFARWILGPHFEATPTGPDPLPSSTKFWVVFWQIACPIAWVLCIWWWVVRPWRREGKMSTTGMFVASGSLLFFWDMCMNYTSVALFYNSHLFNRGAWANDAWPGWTSPEAARLPEPLLLVPPAYLCLVFVQIMFVLWMLRKAKGRWPDLGIIRTVLVIVVALTIIDTIIEMTVLRTGMYAYPGGIRELTLFAGETYQMPLTESFTFGGLGLGSICTMMHFVDDRGRTMAERHVDRLQISEHRRQVVRFFAIFGAMHTAFFVFYMIPNQWLSTHSDPFPENYPSYLENGMCAVGENGDECPGPGVPMPRPTDNPF